METGGPRGVSAIRTIFEKLFGEFAKPGVSIASKQRLLEGEYAHLVWTAETQDNFNDLASDTFVTQNGSIEMQAFTAKTRSKHSSDGDAKAAPESSVVPTWRAINPPRESPTTTNVASGASASAATQNSSIS